MFLVSIYAFSHRSAQFLPQPLGSLRGELLLLGEEQKDDVEGRIGSLSQRGWRLGQYP